MLRSQPRIETDFHGIFHGKICANLSHPCIRAQQVTRVYDYEKDQWKSLSIRGCERSIAMNLCVWGKKICENPSQSVTVSDAMLKIRVFKNPIYPNWWHGLLHSAYLRHAHHVLYLYPARFRFAAAYGVKKRCEVGVPIGTPSESWRGKMNKLILKEIKHTDF